MTQILAVLLGLAVGVGLALPIALRIRRRQRAERAEAVRDRRSTMLGTPAQRHRVLWLAVGLAAVVVLARALGAGVWTGPILMLAILLAAQTVAFGLIATARERRGAGRH